MGDRLLVQIASYNTNLQAERGLPQDLVDWLSPTLQVSSFLAHGPRAPDIIAIGYQELLPLPLGLSGLSKPVIENRNALIISQIEEHAPNKEKYTLIAKVVNVGVALLVYGLDHGVGRRVCDVQTSWTGCGPAYMGNKGGVGVRFRVPGDDDSAGETFTFVCAHLAAHAPQLERRIRDYHHIVGTLLFPPPYGSTSQEKSTIFATSHLFFFGDLNFRLAMPFQHPLAPQSKHQDLITALTNEEERFKLKEYDQLRIERDVHGSAFVGLKEGEFWKFKCSYKFKLGELDRYDAKRMPAWTDRIMYATYGDSPDNSEESGITNLLYTSIPSNTTSDHKPVVSLLFLPPTSSTPAVIPPSLHLASNYHPRPDPYANLKRYTGRLLDRLIGYNWWLLTVIGAGSALFGAAHFVIGLSVWSWWRSKRPDLPVV